MYVFAVVFINLSCKDSNRIIYVYLQCKAPTTLDVRAGRIVLWVKELLPSGLLLLESKDGKECREHSKNFAPCHLSIEDTIHLELIVVLKGLPCFVCGKKTNDYSTIV